MNNERNEHFKEGYAELLWQDLMDVHDGWIDVSDGGLDDEDIEKYKAIIAQRAYDLAMHVLEQASYGAHAFDAEIVFKHVTDLIEWPKTASE